MPSVPLALNPILQSRLNPLQTLRPIPLYPRLPGKILPYCYIHHDGLSGHSRPLDGNKRLRLLRSDLRFLEGSATSCRPALPTERSSLVLQRSDADLF